MAVLIRKAIPTDHARLVEFQIALALESEQLTLNHEKVQRGVQRILTSTDKGEYIVATLPDGEVVGCLLLLTEWSDWRNLDVLWIHSVYVEPKWRKIGIFASMYQWVKDKVMSDDAYGGIRLYVDKTNINAQRTYQKLGMTNHHYDLYEFAK